jgi:hypothetical protein
MYEILSADPDSPSTWFFIGIQKLRIGDISGSKAALDKLEHVAPDWEQAGTLRDIIKSAEAKIQG